jgi:hypothetical protein
LEKRVDVTTILAQIDLGLIALPEFQRGYVWNRDQVRGLMDSLYRKHPVGSLLTWQTRTEEAVARGEGPLAPGVVSLLLDGQQRITSLYGIIRGQAPKFFDGNAQAFTGLYFNLEDEVFEFYAPLKMRENPLWINVTDVMREGVGSTIGRLYSNPDLAPNMDRYIQRVTAVAGISNTDFHIEQVSGADKTVDVVVDIFNKVNSGGTKLSKGDLALAKICAEWPAARDEMKKRLDKWKKSGFDFKLEWLLRSVNTIITGEALFSALSDVSPDDVQRGLNLAEKSIDTLLNMISSRLGLDHDRVLGSSYSFPLMARYLVERGGHVADYRERDKLLYWYVHTFLWGRYAASTESILNQDLHLIEDMDGALDRLIAQLRQNRGDLRIHPNDFRSWSVSARFYPLLYMLTRVHHARDWGSGLELSAMLLGSLNSLQLHHIFPKALLYRHGYARSEVNALANFAFLTQETNLEISDRAPVDYLPGYASKHPGALESSWIPMDHDLWQIERYLDFLEARRELLAKAANEFLDSLVVGAVPEKSVGEPIMERPRIELTGSFVDGDEEQLIREFDEWVVTQGLPTGESPYALVDDETHDVVAVFDIAWPEGLQEGLSQPVALLIDEPDETIRAANSAGFRYFTDVESFKRYIEREILALETVAADD